MCKNIILYDTYIIRLYSRIYGYSRDVDGVVEMDQIFVAQSFKMNLNNFIKLTLEMNLLYALIVINHTFNLQKTYIQTIKEFLEVSIKKAYIINHINNLHGDLTVLIYRFKWLSTKFINNYIAWYKWLLLFNNDKDIVRTKNMLIHSIISFVNTSIKLYKDRSVSFE